MFNISRSISALKQLNIVYGFSFANTMTKPDSSAVKLRCHRSTKVYFSHRKVLLCYTTAGEFLWETIGEKNLLKELSMSLAMREYAQMRWGRLPGESVSLSLDVWEHVPEEHLVLLDDLPLSPCLFSVEKVHCRND